MRKFPYKFEVGQKVRIGETDWDIPEMKAMSGQIGIITSRTNGHVIGNGNAYRLDGLFYFEEECLSFLEDPIEFKEVTNEEVLNILENS